MEALDMDLDYEDRVQLGVAEAFQDYQFANNDNDAYVAMEDHELTQIDNDIEDYLGGRYDN